MDFVEGKFLIDLVRKDGIEFDEIPACNYQSCEKAMLLLIFVQDFDVLDIVKDNKLDLMVLDDILNHQIVGFVD